MKLMQAMIFGLFSPFFLFAADLNSILVPEIVLANGDYKFPESYKLNVLPPNTVPYPRDASFALNHIDGAQYIPKQLSADQFANFQMLQHPLATGYYLDEYGREYFEERKVWPINDISGEGFVDKFSMLKAYFQRHNIAYKEPGYTIIEGGNIAFLKINGETKAIVGDHTILATYLGLEATNQWPESEINQIIKNSPPMRPFYYIARNLKLIEAMLSAKSQQKILKFGKKMEHKKLTEKELLLKDQERLKNYALVISARLFWCKMQIAKELGLKPQEIIFLPQRSYHLDFDLLIASTGAVALRAPKQDVEYKWWGLQNNVLRSHLPPDFMINVPAEFSDPFMFCGLTLSANNSYIFPNSVPRLEKDFKLFLEQSCKFDQAIPVGGVEFFIEKNAGLHCLSQEYNLTPKTKCDSCHSEKKDLLKCSRCEKFYYCNQICQRRDWPKHKLECALKK